jgi:hypothetical protein
VKVDTKQPEEIERRRPQMTEPAKRVRLPNTCMDCGTPIAPRHDKKRCHDCWIKFSQQTTPRQNMLISEWTTDEHGNMCRTITGI